MLKPPARWSDKTPAAVRDEKRARDGNFGQSLLNKRTLARVKMSPARNQVGGRKSQVNSKSKSLVLVLFVLLKCLNFLLARASHAADELLQEAQTTEETQAINQNVNSTPTNQDETTRASNASKVAVKMAAELNPETSDQVPLYMQHMKVILVTLHLSVFVTGLVGNSLVCLSVYRNKSLQTITNYYIVNLAVADFLVILICLPPTVYWDLTLFWNFGLVLCKLVLYLQSISVSVSVLTLTCISIDRWYAICRPLKFSSSKSRAKSTIGLIWLVSMIIASPDVIFLTTKPVYEENDYVYMDCTYSWPESVTKIHQLCIVTLLFVFPFVLMTISYSEIVNVLWRNETMAETMQNSMQLEQDGEKQSKSIATNKGFKSRFNESTIISTTRSPALELPLEQKPPGRQLAPARRREHEPDNLSAIVKCHQTSNTKLESCSSEDGLEQASEQSNSARLNLSSNSTLPSVKTPVRVQATAGRQKLTRIMRRPISCIIRAKLSLTRSTTLTTIASTSSSGSTSPTPSQRPKAAATKTTLTRLNSTNSKPNGVLNRDYQVREVSCGRSNYDKDNGQAASTRSSSKPTEIRINFACRPDDEQTKSAPDESHLGAVPLLQFNPDELDEQELVYEFNDASLLEADQRDKTNGSGPAKTTAIANNKIFSSLSPGADYCKHNSLVSRLVRENCSAPGGHEHTLLPIGGPNQFNLTGQHSNKADLDHLIGQNQGRANSQHRNDVALGVGSLHADVWSYVGASGDYEPQEMRPQMSGIRESAIPARFGPHRTGRRRASYETTTTQANGYAKTNYRAASYSVEALWKPSEFAEDDNGNSNEGDQMIRGLVISLGRTTTSRERADEDQRTLKLTRDDDLGARGSRRDRSRRNTFAGEHGRVCPSGELVGSFAATVSAKGLSNGRQEQDTVTGVQHLCLACAHHEVSQPRELKGRPLRRSNTTTANKHANHQNNLRRHHRHNHHHHRHHRHHHHGHQHHQSATLGDALSRCERPSLVSCRSHGSIKSVRDVACDGRGGQCWHHQRPVSPSTSPCCGPQYNCLNWTQSSKQFATLERRHRRATGQRRRRQRDDNDGNELRAGAVCEMGFSASKADKPQRGQRQQQQLLSLKRKGEHDFRRRPSPCALLATLSDGCECCRTTTTRASVRSDRAGQRRSRCDYSNSGPSSSPPANAPVCDGTSTDEMELNESVERPHNSPAAHSQHLCHHARLVGGFSSDQDAQIGRASKRELTTDTTSEGSGQGNGRAGNNNQRNWTGNGTDDVGQGDDLPRRKHVYVAAVGGNEINWPLCNGSGAGGQLALGVIAGGPIQSTSSAEDNGALSLVTTKRKSYDFNRPGESAPAGRRNSSDARQQEAPPGHVWRVGPGQLGGGGAGNGGEQLAAKSSLSGGSNSLLVHETLLSSSASDSKQRPDQEVTPAASIDEPTAGQLNGRHLNRCADALLGAQTALTTANQLVDSPSRAAEVSRLMESAPRKARNCGTLTLPKQSLANRGDNSPARLVRITTNIVRLTPLTSAADGLGGGHVCKLHGGQENYRSPGGKQRSGIGPIETGDDMQQPMGQLDQRQPVDRSVGQNCSVCCCCCSGESPARYHKATAQMGGEDYRTTAPNNQAPVGTASKEQREMRTDAAAAADTKSNQRPSSSRLMRGQRQQPVSVPNCDGATAESSEGAAGACHDQENHPAAAAGRLQVQLMRSPRSSSVSNNGTTTQNSLQHQQSHPTTSSGRYYKLIESRKKAAKMLIVIVIMFGLCYLPVHFLNILRYTTGLPQNDLTMIASLVSHWLCYFNSAVNPLIYNFMSETPTLEAEESTWRATKAS